MLIFKQDTLQGGSQSVYSPRPTAMDYGVFVRIGWNTSYWRKKLQYNYKIHWISARGYLQPPFINEGSFPAQEFDDQEYIFLSRHLLGIHLDRTSMDRQRSRWDKDQDAAAVYVWILTEYKNLGNSVYCKKVALRCSSVSNLAFSHLS